jgi:hypothetical protein
MDGLFTSNREGMETGRRSVGRRDLESVCRMASLQPIPGAAKEHMEQVLGMDCGTFCFEGQFQVGSEYYQQASEERKRRMEKFAEGCAGTNFEFNPSDITRERIGRHATNAGAGVDELTIRH